MNICLDAGHSFGLNGKGKDPGAVNNELGLRESVIAMEMVQTLGQMLTEKGHTVVYTRTNGDDTISLPKRCRIANDKKVDMFISIHLNSAENKDANGIETLMYPTKNRKTHDLADTVQTKLILATGARNRSVKARENLYVLKHTNMPAILIETGFISNREEALKLNDPEYQRKICTAILEGILTCW